MSLVFAWRDSEKSRDIVYPILHSKEAPPPTPEKKSSPQRKLHTWSVYTVPRYQLLQNIFGYHSGCRNFGRLNKPEKTCGLFLGSNRTFNTGVFLKIY